MIRFAPTATLLLALALCCEARAALSFDDKIEDYVVKPGDTISDITYDFLGDAHFWEDNWKLNPQVRDPDRLRIGQVLRIIVQRKVIAESARVLLAVNQTQKMLSLPNWQPAEAGDTLASGQGLRTRENSTAELGFNTESTLRLGEFSQVFLTRKETTLRGIDRGSITVEQGAVDLVFAPLAQPRTRIELVAGPATATPSVAPNARGEIRAGNSESGGAKVMVFAGSSAVAASGVTVAVETGMGTRVPESGPPATPEHLLAAPEPRQSGLEWNYSNGLLHWTAVATAAGYVVEVCADRQCSTPLQRHELAANATRVQVQPLPAGTSWWRIHAISASDLDGYSSRASRIQVTDATPDLEAPMLALEPLSGFVTGTDGAARLGPQARLRVQVQDERSGVETVEWRLGADAPWQRMPDDVLDLSGLHGPAAIALRATDRLGQTSPELSLDLIAQ